MFTATYLQEEGLKDLYVWQHPCWLAWHYYKQNVSVKQINIQNNLCETNKHTKQLKNIIHDA